MFPNAQEWAVVHQQHKDKLVEAARARLAQEAQASLKNEPHRVALLAQQLGGLLRGMGRQPTSAHDMPCCAAAA